MEKDRVLQGAIQKLGCLLFLSFSSVSKMLLQNQGSLRKINSYGQEPEKKFLTKSNRKDIYFKEIQIRGQPDEKMWSENQNGLKAAKSAGKLNRNFLLFPGIRTRRCKRWEIQTRNSKMFSHAALWLNSGTWEVDESKLLARLKNGCAFLRLPGPQLRKINTSKGFLNIQLLNLLEDKARCCWSCFIPYTLATGFC